MCSVLHDGRDLIYYVAFTPLSLECECEFGICLSIGDTVDIIDQSYTMPHTWVQRYRHELLLHLALPLYLLCALCMQHVCSTAQASTPMNSTDRDIERLSLGCVFWPPSLLGCGGRLIPEMVEMYTELSYNCLLDARTI